MNINVLKQKLEETKKECINQEQRIDAINISALQLIIEKKVKKNSLLDMMNLQ